MRRMIFAGAMLLLTCNLFAGTQPATAHPKDTSKNVTACQLLKEPRIKAMLEVIAFTEGTKSDYGRVVNGLVLRSPYYPDLIGKRNVSVTDLTRHPNILVQVNPLLTSSAAGRYQYKRETWDERSMPDFSETSQNIAAVELMRHRGMIAALLADDLGTAVSRGASEWASLPTALGVSYYGGQPARSMKEIQSVYGSALEKYLPTVKK